MGDGGGQVMGAGASHGRRRTIAEALRDWAEATPRTLSGRSVPAKAFRCMLARWGGLLRCFADGRLARNFEYLARTAAAPVRLAMITIMPRRLART
jgi:hypothetical protein